MRILVTGHKGFIGSHVTEGLQREGHIVIGVDKKQKASQDLSDGFTFGLYIDRMAYKPEFIVHIAGSCSTQKGLDDPVSDFRDNALATFNVINTAKYLKVPILYISTCKVMPNEQDIRTPYGLSKWIGEEYIREFNACYGLEYIINRCGTIYGSGQEGSPESGWIAWFTKAAREKLPITINGNGKQTRDLLHVSDLVALIVDQITNFTLYQNDLYEVGGGKKNTVNLLDVLHYLNYDNFEYGDPRIGDSLRYVADLTYVSSINDWKPKVSWEEGLKELL